MNSTANSPRPDVSVIIPIYNAEAHLHACLESALGQTLENIKIICVNDCSNDESHRIVEKFAAIDPRVQLLTHASNQGEGAARNTGLDHATGKFIFHLDADDTIPLNALLLLFTQATACHSDMVKGSYIRFDEDDKDQTPIWRSPAHTVTNTNIYQSDYLRKIPASHCSYLYRRKFLKYFEIRYPTDLAIGLDLIALSNALVKAGKVTIIPDIVYHYRQSKNSITRRGLSEERLLEDIKAKKTVYDILQSAQVDGALQSWLQSWEWQIKAYWITMAHSQSVSVCSSVFSHFRFTVGREIVPWRENTLPQHRYFLALLLTEQDEAAIAFLRSDTISVGFSNPDELHDALTFVLAQFPNDLGTLYSLACIASKKNDFELAKELFETLVLHNNGHLDAQLQLANILRKCGDLKGSRATLQVARETLETNGFNGSAIKSLFHQHNRLVIEENQTLIHKPNVAVSELKTKNRELKHANAALKARKSELEAIYASYSWRLTSPLRNIMKWLKK